MSSAALAGLGGHSTSPLATSGLLGPRLDRAERPQRLPRCRRLVFLYAPAEGLVADSKSLSNLVVPVVGNPFSQAAVWEH
jgi:hypothetical protein